MIVEDQASFRRLLAALLDREADIEVVAQAGSLETARSHAASADLEVVLLDLNLPDGNGWDLITDLREANPAIAVLVLSASFDAASMARATEAGADAILDKFAIPRQIVDAVRDLPTSRRSGGSF